MTIDDFIKRLENSTSSDYFNRPEWSRVEAATLIFGDVWTFGDTELIIRALKGFVGSALVIVDKIFPDNGRMHTKGRVGDEPLFACSIYRDLDYPLDGIPFEIGTGEHDIESIAIMIALLNAIKHRRTHATN